MGTGPLAELGISIPTTFTLPTDAKHTLVNQLSNDIVDAIKQIKSSLTLTSDASSVSDPSNAILLSYDQVCSSNRHIL